MCFVELVYLINIFAERKECCDDRSACAPLVTNHGMLTNTFGIPYRSRNSVAVLCGSGFSKRVCRRVMKVWPYPGANFGRRSAEPTRAQRYHADKAALLRAEKYFTPEEFASDLQDARISLRIYEDGVVIDRRVG
jgi:hypothetical protein